VPPQDILDSWTVSIESDADLEGLQRVGRVVALTLAETQRAVEPGVSTAELDAVASATLARHGARSAPALVYGFPGAICISVNDEAVHGVPGPRRLAAGDAVTLDVTAELGGYMADAAVTVLVPPSTRLAERLVGTAETALAEGITAARAGRPLRAIGRAVGRAVDAAGFTVLRPLSGHGIGRTIHEPPDVLNYDEPRSRGRLTAGLVITIEPIISARGQALRQDADGWTVRTHDGSLTAHAEHTVVVARRGSPLVLTSVA
jgi:methionyl aminopeptidase